MAAKKLTELSEEELVQLAEAYYKQMDDIMNEEDDEVACEKVFKKYIQVYEQLATMNFEKYADVLMKEYLNFAEFYFNFTEHERRGLNVLKKRVELCQKLTQTRPEYVSELQTSYSELGDQYDGLGFTKKADEMYRLAEEIKQKSK